MASGNNGGDVHDLTIEILKSIRDEMRTGFASVRDEIKETNAQLGARIDETNARLDVHSQALVRLIGEVGSLNTRFDHFLTGTHRTEHEELPSPRAR